MASTPTSPPPSLGRDNENRLFVNLRKQAKFILLGLALCYWFDTLARIEVALALNKGWARSLAIVSLTLLVLSVTLFAILMLLPLRGRSLDYQSWQSDTHLRHLIPWLTFTLSSGFLSLLFTLSPLISTSLSVPVKRKLSLSPTYLLTLNTWAYKAGISLETSQYLASLLGKTGIFALNHPLKRMDLKPNWMAAFASAVGTYMLVLGVVGLLGMVTTRTTWGKSKVHQKVE
ncbi:unnamed protein product [Sympodiomycopsis kandeliae]